MIRFWDFKLTGAPPLLIYRVMQVTGVTTSTPSKGKQMAASRKNLLVVNVLFWVVGALLHPLASLLPAGSGETPKIFSLLIPLLFLLLAFGSTYMMARALCQQKEQSDANAEQGVAPDSSGIK